MDGRGSSSASASAGRVRTKFISCTPCRQRKVRCTGERPTCRACARRNTQCEYLERPKRRGPDRNPGGRLRYGFDLGNSPVPPGGLGLGRDASTLPNYAQHRAPANSHPHDSVHPRSYHLPEHLTTIDVLGRHCVEENRARPPPPAAPMDTRETSHLHPRGHISPSPRGVRPPPRPRVQHLQVPPSTDVGAVPPGRSLFGLEHLPTGGGGHGNPNPNPMIEPSRQRHKPTPASICEESWKALVDRFGGGEEVRVEERICQICMAYLAGPMPFDYTFPVAPYTRATLPRYPHLVLTLLAHATLDQKTASSEAPRLAHDASRLVASLLRAGWKHESLVHSAILVAAFEVRPHRCLHKSRVHKSLLLLDRTICALHYIDVEISSATAVATAAEGGWDRRVAIAGTVREIWACARLWFGGGPGRSWTRISCLGNASDVGIVNGRSIKDRLIRTWLDSADLARYQFPTPWTQAQCELADMAWEDWLTGIWCLILKVQGKRPFKAQDMHRAWDIASAIRDRLDVDPRDTTYGYGYEAWWVVVLLGRILPSMSASVTTTRAGEGTESEAESEQVSQFSAVAALAGCRERCAGVPGKCRDMFPKCQELARQTRTLTSVWLSAEASEWRVASRD